jgi:hypothetical protein
MNKIDTFGDADDLEEIEYEKEVLSKKGLLKIKSEKSKSERNSARERSHSESSSSSFQSNQKSEKSMEKV